MSRETSPIELTEATNPLETPKRVALIRPDIRPTLRRQEEKWVMTFPHLIIREVILFQVVLIALSLAALIFDAPLEGIANPLETPNPAKAPWYFLGLQELLHYFPPIVAGVVLPGMVVLALAIVPYARINLSAAPLWLEDSRAKRIWIGSIAVLLTAFATVHCWPLIPPTVAIAAGMAAARGGEEAGRLRRYLSRVTLPEWIMTWFVLVATILTLIGTFFRGPGWSLVWPWAMHLPA